MNRAEEFATNRKKRLEEDEKNRKVYGSDYSSMSNSEKYSILREQRKIGETIKNTNIMDIANEVAKGNFISQDKAKSYNGRLDNYITQLNSYKIGDEGAKNELLKYAIQLNDSVRGMSSFDSEDSYKAAIEASKRQYEYESANLDEKQSEVDDLRSAMNELNQLGGTNHIGMMGTPITEAGEQRDSDLKAKRLDILSRYGVKSTEELEKKLSEKEQFIQNATDWRKWSEDSKKSNDELSDLINQSIANHDTESEIYYREIYNQKNADPNGEEDTKNAFWESVLAGFDQWNSRIANGADSTLGNILRGVGWENNPISEVANYYDRSLKLRQHEIQKANAKTANGDATKEYWLNKGTELISGTFAAVPDALLALATAGQSGVAGTTEYLQNNFYMSTGSVLERAGLTAANIAKNPQYWSTFVGEYGSDYKEAIQNGQSELVAGLSATVTALLNSAVEIGLEGDSGIEGLFKRQQDQTRKQAAKEAVLDWVKSSLEEGNEEVVQGVIQRTIQKVSGSDVPVFSLGGNGVIDPATALEEWGMGAAVGAILGGGESVIASAANAKSVADARSEAIGTAGAEIAENGELQNLSQIAENLPDSFRNNRIKSLARAVAEENTKDYSAKELDEYNRKVGKLYGDVASAQRTAIMKSGKTTDTDIMSERLAKIGVNSDKRTAKVFLKAQRGEELTDSERKVFRAAGGSDTKTKLDSNTETVQSEVSKRNNAEFTNRAKEIAKTNSIFADTKNEFSKEGKTTRISTGEEVELKDIASIKDGKMNIRLSDGSVANSDDIIFKNRNEALLYDSVASMGVTADIANSIVNGYDGSIGVEAYVKGMEEGFKYGQVGQDINTIGSDTFFADLTQTQKETAYQLGRISAKYAADNAQAAITQAKNPAIATQGKVHFASDMSSMTDRQKVSVSTIGRVVADVTHNDVYIYQSKLKNGKRVFAEDIGGHKTGESAPNGFYDRDTGSIYIDAAAGNNGEGVMLWTFAHETAHFVKQWSPTKFNALSDFIMEEYGKQGVDVHNLTLNKIANAKKNGRSITYDTAHEEVIADSLQTMFTDTNLAEKLIRLKAKDQSLWEKIKSFVSDLYSRIQAAYKGLDPQTVEGKYVRQMKDSIERISDLFAEATVDAGENFSKIGSNYFSENYAGVPSQETTADIAKGIEVNSDRTYSTPMEKFIMPLGSGKAKLFAKGKKFTTLQITENVANTFNTNTVAKKKIQATKSVLDEMSRFMKDAAVTYRFIGLDDVNDASITYDANTNRYVFSAMVKNGEYPVNFDFTTICKKRDAASRFVDELLTRTDENGNKLSQTYRLTARNLFLLNEAMRRSGYETACLGCFVEAKRYNVDEWGGTIVKEWNESVSKYNKDAGFLIEDGKDVSVSDLSSKQLFEISEELDTVLKDNTALKKQEAYRRNLQVAKDNIEVIETDIKVQADALISASDALSNAVTDKDRARLQKAVAKAEKALDSSKLKLEKAQNKFNKLISQSKQESSITPAEKADALIKSDERYQKKIKLSDILTKEGIRHISSEYPELLTFIKTRYGTATPKLTQGFTPYNSEIALLPNTKSKLQLSEYLYSIAGIRAQSFSDFKVEYVFDYLQMFADAYMRDLPMHAYTKEISFAKLFGRIGAKINMSVMYNIMDGTYWESNIDALKAIGETETDGEKLAEKYAGMYIDENGRLSPLVADRDMAKYFKDKYGVTMPVQSINYAEAVELMKQEGYTKNIGTIGVGYGDYLIRKLLRDPNIRYVIPYHRSSLPVDINEMANLKYARDYTAVQNTMEISAISVNGELTTIQEWLKSNGFNRIDSKNAIEVVKELNNQIASGTVKISTKKAKPGHGDFNLYTGKDGVRNTNDPVETVNRYVAECLNKGLLPVFYEFADEENYYKLHYDFNVYDNVTGEYAPQTAVGYDIGSIDEFKNTVSEYMEEQNKYREEMFTEDKISTTIATFRELADADKVRQEKKSQLNSDRAEDNILRLENEISDLENQISDDIFDEIPSDERKRINNKIWKLRGELNKLVLEERKASVKTSLSEIRDNLDNYRYVDLRSLAEQLKYEDYEELSKEELAESIRYSLDEIEAEWKEDESSDFNAAQNGLYVRPIQKEIESNIIQFPSQSLYSDRVSNKELAEADDTALYIKNTKKANYIGMILNGIKTEETRSRRTLDAYIGKEFFVTDGKKVYGSIVLGEPHKITAEEFHSKENQKKHRVPVGDDYDVKEGGFKWAYPIESYKKFDAPKDLSESTEYKNSFQARQILYSGRGNGYDGYSMSNNARDAYASGEMPLSKWSKSEIVSSVEDINPSIDISGINLETLRKHMLTRSSWHHTSMYYNRTDFYSVDKEYVESMTQEDVDRMKENEIKTEKKVRDKSLDSKIDDAYFKIQTVVNAGLYKNESGAIRKLLESSNFDEIYEKAKKIIIEREARRVDKWRSLPDDHYRKEFVEMFDNDIDNYISKEYAYKTLSRNSTTFKKLTEFFGKQDDSVLYSERDYSAKEQYDAVKKQLNKENARLKEDLANVKELLKIQSKTTGGKMLNKTSVLASAKKLMRDYGIGGEATELASHLNGVYNYIIGGDEVTWEGIQDKIRPVVDWMLKNDKSSGEISAESKEVLKDLRKYTVSLTETQKQEAASIYGSYNNFRKQMLGSITISDNASVTLESAWNEIVDRHPGYFPDNVNEGDMVTALADGIYSIKNSSTYAGEDEAYAQELQNAVYDSYWNVSTIKTVADKYQREISLLKARHKEKMDAIREDRNAKIAEIKMQNAERIKNLRSQYKEKIDREVQETKDRYQKRIDKAKENTSRTKYINRIAEASADLSKRLLHPTSKTAIPEVFGKYVAKFIGSIDFQTYDSDGNVRGKTSENANKAREDLRNTILGMSAELDAMSADEGNVMIPPDMQSWINEISTSLEELYTPVGTFSVHRMNSAQLKVLYQMTKSLQTIVNQASKSYVNMSVDINEQAQSSIDYMTPITNKEKSVLLKPIEKVLRWDYGQPITIFSRFGDGGLNIFRGLMKGQATEAKNVDAIKKFAEKAYTESDARKWQNDPVTVRIGGNEYKLTTAYLMELHCLLQDPDARRHIIEGGGVRFADITLNGKTRSFETVFFDTDDMIAVENALDKIPRAKATAEAMEKFMADTGAKWGNEISVVRFGYHAFGGNPNYYPIKTIASGSEYEANQKRSNIYALLNKSFTKDRKIGANNAVVVGDIFDTFSRHMSEMAIYNAWSLPVIDAIRWYNYTEAENKDIGKTELKLSEVMREAYGKNADEYFRRLMESINSQRSGGLSEELAFKSLRIFNRVAVAANIRVYIQQPFSITRALDELDGRFIKLIGKTEMNKAYDEMLEHSSFGLWKSMGYYDVDVSKPIEADIKKNESFADKITEKSMTPAEMGDRFTWTVLWNACKNEAKAKNRNASNEVIMQKTAQRFDELIAKTQVVDSVLTKSQWMRSDSFWHRSTSAFMSEPMTSYNTLLRKYDQFQRDAAMKGTSYAIQKNGKGIAKTTAVFFLTQLVNALATAPLDAMRDDDDYKTYLEKLIEKFGRNTLQNVIPTSMMPYFGDIVEYAMYGSSDRADLQMYTKLIDFGKQIGNTIDGYSVTKLHKTINSALSLASSFSGLPMSNVARDVIAIWNTTVGQVNYGSLKFQTSDDSNSAGYKKFYSYLKNGNEERTAYLYAQMMSNSVNPDNIYSYVQNLIKEEYKNGDISSSEAESLVSKTAMYCGKSMTIDEIRKKMSKW